MTAKHIILDIVGTLLMYDALYAAIDKHLGNRLRAHGVRSRLRVPLGPLPASFLTSAHSPPAVSPLQIEFAKREYT